MRKRAVLVVALLATAAGLGAIVYHVPNGDGEVDKIRMETSDARDELQSGHEFGCTGDFSAIYTSYVISADQTLVDPNGENAPFGGQENEQELLDGPDEYQDCLGVAPPPADDACIGATIESLGAIAEGDDGETPTVEEIVAAATPCLGGPQIEEESLTSSNANDQTFARDGDTLTLNFDSTGPITTPTVTFARAGSDEFAQDVQAMPRGGNEDGTEWTATTDAPGGDGAITARVSYEEDPDGHQPVGGVMLDNTAPSATITLPSLDFVDSTATTSVNYDVSIQESNLDTGSSSHEWDNGDGPNTELVADCQCTGDIPADDQGTFSVTLDLLDMAGNRFELTASIPYRPPGIQASLASNNADGSFASAGDTVTLTLSSPDDITALQVDFFVAGDPVTEPVTVDDTDPRSVSAWFEPDVEGPEGGVTFQATLTTAEGQDVVTATGDGSGVVVDFTAPATALEWPQLLPDGSLGVAPTEPVTLLATFPDDMDALGSTVTVSCTSAGSECDDDEFPVLDTLVSEDQEAGTVTYSIEKGHFGAGTITFSGEAKDAAGNAASWSTGALDVVVLAERVTVTLTEDGSDVNRESLLIGKGDPNGELTFDVDAVYEEFDQNEARGLGGIFVEFVHGAGDGLQVASDDAVVLIMDEAGKVVGLEFETPASAAFSFSVTNTESGGLATGDELVLKVTATAPDFTQIGGVLASTSIVADVDGPTIAAHEYPMAGGDGRIDYLEFKDNGEVIVAEIAGIAEVGGSEPADMVVGFFDESTFVPLGSTDLTGWVDGEIVTVQLDTADLPSGDQTLVAIASDALGNDGEPSEVPMYIGIRQFIIVTPHEDPVWVSPEGDAAVSFTLEPSDVVQDILRYDLRTADDGGEYALSRFIGGGAFSGLTGAGELQLVRFKDPANDQPLSLEGAQSASVFGHDQASHETISEFELTVLNKGGQASAFQIVTLDQNGDLEPFTGPVFTAKIDAVSPSLAGVELEEDPDENGHHQAADDGVLTFTFEADDVDSGLAVQSPIRVDVCDADDCTEGPWTAVQGAALDITEGSGSITIPRDAPGAFTYRVVARDEAGNEAVSQDLDVTVVGNEAADIALAASQEGRDLQGAAGVLYAGMDSLTPDEDADSSDEVVLQATVLVAGQVEEGLDVELSFSGVQDPLDEVTDSSGQVSWTIEPDDFGFDLAAQTFTVTVVPQTIDHDDGTQTFVSASSEPIDILWTGFHVEVSGPDDAGVGEAFDIDAEVYWLHDVYTDSGIVLDGASPAAFSGTVSLDEDVGAQTLTDTAVPAVSATGGQASLSVTRGDAPVPGTSSDPEAGYRSYSAVLDVLPYGMEAPVQSTSHEVLVSGIRLLVDLEPMGMAGQDADVTMDAEWLHPAKLDGSAEDRALGPVQVQLSGAMDGDADVDGAPATVQDAYPAGPQTLVLQGSSGGPFQVFGASAEMHGIEVEFPGMPQGMVGPGDDLVEKFNVVIDGDVVTPSYAGITKTLATRQAGEAQEEVSYTGQPLAGQDPFSVVLIESDQTETEQTGASFDFSDDGINWEMTLPSPDAGEYGLALDVIVAHREGTDYVVSSTESFYVSHSIYVIEGIGTMQDGQPPLDITDEAHWFDRGVVEDVVHSFAVKRADWDGSAAQNHAPADDGTKVQVWQSLDAGATWQEHGAPITLGNGDGTASFDAPRTSDATADKAYRVAVVEDSDGAFAAPDGLGSGTVPYMIRFLFTGISLEFSSMGDQIVPVGQDITVEVRATFDHDGSAVPQLSVQLDDDRPASADLVTDGDGWATTTYSSSQPQSITGLVASADGPHNLAAATTSHPGALRWVDLGIAPLVVEETADGSTWQAVQGDGNVYTVAPGQFVRVTATVVIDDGETELPVDGGHLRFGTATPSPLDSSGSASKAYFKSSAGTTGEMMLDVLGATRDGVDYGDADDAGSFTIHWSNPG